MTHLELTESITQGPFSKKAIAAMVGVPAYTLSYWLTGRVRIPEVKARLLTDIISAGSTIQAEARAALFSSYKLQ